jgi:hypothetical protein
MFLARAPNCICAKEYPMDANLVDTALLQVRERLEQDDVAVRCA